MKGDEVMAKMKYWDGQAWVILDAKDADTLDGKHAIDFADKVELDNHLNNHPQGFSGDYNDLTNTPTITKNIVDGKAAGSIRTINASDSVSFPLGMNSFAGGENCIASGSSSFCFGEYSSAEGYSSFSAGSNCTAGGQHSIALGYHAVASGSFSYAGGYDCESNGRISHAEGSGTRANGANSHAEGYYATATGENSHSQNEFTEANGKSQTVIGRYNIAQGSPTTYSDTDYAFIIGNGTRDARSNALTCTWDGTLNVEKSMKVAGKSVLTYKTTGFVSGVKLASESTVPKSEFDALQSEVLKIKAQLAELQQGNNP